MYWLLKTFILLFCIAGAFAGLLAFTNSLQYEEDCVRFAEEEYLLEDGSVERRFVCLKTGPTKDSQYIRALKNGEITSEFLGEPAGIITQEEWEEDWTIIVVPVETRVVNEEEKYEPTKITVI